ncbi:hypothetical protein FRB95_004910 [Tulasnella sp. JGI-2019a]|nr:hypothetical protein FRB95_004910 [Tulasnella sp. JGI-2019a]
MATSPRRPSMRPSNRRFSLSISISPSILSRRQSVASSSFPSPQTPAPLHPPGPFKRVLRRIASVRILPRRFSRTSSYQWPVVDTDYMYDDDIDTTYEGLLRLAARIGDAKPKHLPDEFKATLPRGIYNDCEPAQMEEQCAICLDAYKPTDEVLGIAECSHYFHARCFETWLDMGSNCPVCRRDLTPVNYRWEPTTPSTSPNTPAALHYEQNMMDEYGMLFHQQQHQYHHHHSQQD